MKRLFLTCLWLTSLLSASAISPDSAQMAIDTFALHPDMQHASMTIAVSDINTGNIIFHNTLHFCTKLFLVTVGIQRVLIIFSKVNAFQKASFLL